MSSPQRAREIVAKILRSPPAMPPNDCLEYVYQPKKSQNSRCSDADIPVMSEPMTAIIPLFSIFLNRNVAGIWQLL
jgi:hypothetical protein